MDTLFGIPAHVLFLHVPVVVVPMVAAMVIALALRSRWPRWFELATVGGAALSAVATFVAVRSGEAFDRLLEGKAPTERHESLARTTLLLVISLLIVTASLVTVRARSARTSAPKILGLCAVALAILSTVWIVRTGHEGSRITWSGVVREASR